MANISHFHQTPTVVLPEHLIARSLELGATIATAESLTAGLISAHLADVAGASSVLKGAIVSYAISIKRELLGVDAQILSDPALGAVSQQCACQMADGARRLLASTLAVSATGIAGPGGAEPNKPVGTVFIGIATPQNTYAKRFQFMGTRALVREQTVHQAFELLYSALGEL